MYERACRKCGCFDLFVKPSGTAKGLYCSDCGAWIKWLGKDELRAFEHANEQNTATTNGYTKQEKELLKSFVDKIINEFDDDANDLMVEDKDIRRRIKNFYLPSLYKKIN